MRDTPDEIEVWSARLEATKELLATRDLPVYVRRCRTPPPKKLYHFTSTAGLIGILQSGTLRLTRSVCSNDASEVRHVVESAEVISEVLINMSAQGGLADWARGAVARLHDLTRQDRAGWNRERRLEDVLGSDSDTPDPYIACFCDGDQPPTVVHWGHYGRAGEGCALEIDTTRLPDPWPHRFVKVNYDSSAQMQEVVRVLDEFLLREPDDLSTDMGLILESVIRALAISMKDEVFKLENEWRVTWLREVDDGDINVKVRSDGGEIVSFVEMPLPLDAIRRITLGTKRDIRRSGGSLSSYLRGRDADHVIIDESKIPFR